MIPQMSPYVPALYQPDSFGRYRKYPHFVETPIPGAGFQVGELVWAEQELNLDGGPPQTYGSYSKVPLRGLGAASAGLRMNIPRAPSTMASRQTSSATAQTQVARRAPAPPPMRPSMRFSSPSTPRMAPVHSMAPRRAAARTGLSPRGGAEMAHQGNYSTSSSRLSERSTMAPRRESAQTGLSRRGEQTMAHQGSYSTVRSMSSGRGGGEDERDDEDTFLERRDVDAHDLGQTFDIALPKASMMAVRPTATAQTMLSPSPSGAPPSSSSSLPTAEDYGYDVAAEIAAAAAAAEQAAANMQQPAEEQQPAAFLKRKVGPVPYWAIGVGGAVVLGGGIFFMMRR